MSDRPALGRGIIGRSEFRLLLVDSDESLKDYALQRLQTEGYQIDHCSTTDEAKTKMRAERYDILIMGTGTDSTFNLELFDFIKEDPSFKWVPLIVLGERNDVQEKIKCLQLGADDYISKPFEYEELSARIYNLLLRIKSMAEMAFRDPLTGVNNRRYFDQQIMVELERVSRYPTPLSIVFIDIDKFKSINDTYGHHIGDLVLQSMAYVLQKNLRASDFLARFGGEEFVIVLPGTTALEAQKVVQAVLDQLQGQPIAQSEGVSYTITFSAGVAEYSTKMSKDQWIKLADEAMYKAKQTGRNRVLIAEGETSGSDEGLKKALVASHDKALRSMIVAKLEQFGVKTCSATNGEEARKLITSFNPHLCVMDAIMPQYSGLSLLESFVSKDDLNRKVIIMVERNRASDAEYATVLGAHGVLVKPFSLVEMEIRIKKLLGLE